MAGFKHCGKHHEQYPEEGSCKYCVAEAKASEEQAADDKSPADLSKLTKVQLLDLCEERNIDVHTSSTKDELIAALDEHKDAAA
jgi:hypothetical protein